MRLVFVIPPEVPSPGSGLKENPYVLDGAILYNRLNRHLPLEVTVAKKAPVCFPGELRSSDPDLRSYSFGSPELDPVIRIELSEPPDMRIYDFRSGFDGDRLILSSLWQYWLYLVNVTASIE
jgi:hypothetical protein